MPRWDSRALVQGLQVGFAEPFQRTHESWRRTLQELLLDDRGSQLTRPPECMLQE